MPIGPALRQEIEATFVTVPAKCTTEELCIVCPECGDQSGHRSINLKTTMTSCFRCGKGRNNKGSFLGWARALGYEFTSAESVSQVSFEDIIQESNREEFYLPPPRDVDLPNGFTLIADEPKSVYTECIVEMAERKHLTREDFIAARVGFTRQNDHWEPYAIFPVFDTMRIVYYQGRTYQDQEGETTKKFPNRQEVPYGARYWLYNLDALRYGRGTVALVVESILNVLSLKKKLRQLGRKDVVPVCCFQHRISKYQFSRLLQCEGVKEICFLFDHDATKDVWAMSAPAIGRRITIAEMPKVGDNDKTDPNDDVDLAMEAFEARKPFSAANIVLHKMEAHHARYEADCSNERIGSIRK